MIRHPFAHLHCHSHYSLLDGAGTIDGLLARAKALQMNALALTDHGNLHGSLKFYQKAKEVGVNPILGLETYIAPGSRLQKDAGSLKEASFHLTLLAFNRTGFQNLMQLSSKAFLEGFYFKPRIDRELLESCNEGLFCLSGCLSSELSRLLLAGGEANLEKARETVAWFQKVFGDRYFIELQNNGLEVQRVVLEAAADLAERMGLPTVATSDVHYVLREDAEAQDVLLCVNTGKFLSDTNRMKMDSNEFYLRSPEEMYAAFPGREEALRRSQEIADRVAIDLDLGQRHFPVYALPENVAAEDRLRQLCLERAAGAIRRRSAALRRRAVVARGDGAAGSRTRRDQQARLPQLLPHRLGFRPLRPLPGHRGHRPRLRRGIAGRLRPAAKPRLSACSTTCSSSGSSTRAAARRRTSTSTSASSGAAR